MNGIINGNYILNRGPGKAAEPPKPVILTKGDNANETDESSNGDDAGNDEAAAASS